MNLNIRPAQTEDYEAVAAFCSRIWEGHDYVPQLWQEWLNDPQGLLTIATWEDIPVAVVRADLSSPGEAWLEGMRVDPGQRRRGISSALFQALMEDLARRGIRVTRLMTLWNNGPVHRMCARLGFRQVLRLRQRFRALEQGTPSSALRPLMLEEAPLAEALLARRGVAARPTPPFLAVTGGLYSRGGGLWQSWNQDRLRQHLDLGQVWVWEEAGLPKAIAVVNPHRRRPGVYEVGMLEGPTGACSLLLEALVHREEIPPTGTEYPAMARISLPLEQTRLHRTAAAAGYRFHPGWRGEMWIFEHRQR